MSAPWWMCASLLLLVVVLVATATSPASEPPLVSSLLQMAESNPSLVTAATAFCILDNNLQMSSTQFQKLLETVSELKKTEQGKSTSLRRPRHCRDLLEAGDTLSGIREVYPFLKHPDASVSVFCEQTVDGGGWTVFQRRKNLTQREDFYRTWIEYRLGFGHMEGEFWLGLDLLHELTSTALQEMRVDLKDYEGAHRFAKYGKFYVGPLDKYYAISVGRYSGTAGNGLGDGRHDGHKFSTYDSDHDGDSTNCAQTYRGAWWYDKCHISNLNGFQHLGQHDSYADGINWRPWKGYHYSLQETAMMIRPAF